MSDVSEYVGFSTEVDRTKYATYVSYPVTVTRWRVECDCPSDIGRVECKSENAVKGMLMHHMSQSEHIAWQEAAAT